MNRLEAILENRAIDAWVKHFARAPGQVNAPHQSDAEIIPAPGAPGRCLAITVDTVAEEIAAGLYREPYTMGWVTIMACLSDLAAVGADPLGVVVSVCLEPCRSGAFIDGIARGIEDACRALGVHVLGGDTNATPSIALTACALGLVERETLMTRRGCEAGDAVFLTSRAGLGNALGLVRLAGLPDPLFPEELYRPVAALRGAKIVREYASCCMDTSDGLLTTVDQLMRLNGTGFVIECDWDALVAPEALSLCRRAGTPPWWMIAGPHGEFQLLFTVPERRVGAFCQRCRSEGVDPLRIGAVQVRPAVSLRLPAGRTADVDMAPLRNLLESVEGDLRRYLAEFRCFGEKWGLE